MDFNWLIYKELNPDLERIGFKNEIQYKKHYYLHGIQEGRKWRFEELYPYFNTEQYKNNYIDLRELNDIELQIHWINIGRYQNRKYYKIKNGQLDGSNNIQKNERIKCDDDKKISYFNNINFLSNLDKLLNIYSKNYKKSIQKSKNIDISFIINYENNIELLFMALITLNKSINDNFEVVIVYNKSIEDITWLKLYGFKFSVKIIKNDDNNKNTVVMNYNLALYNCIGKIIVIQKSECIHLGDIPEYIMKNFKYDQYLSFPCYSSNSVCVNDYILNNIDRIYINNIEDLVKNINNNIVPVWNQHSALNNKNLNFCTVIGRDYLDILGGFSEKYVDGYCFEDEDLIYRIKNVLKLDIKSIELDENIGVINLYHGNNIFINILENELDIEKRAYYEKYLLNMHINIIEKNEKQCNYPKLLHYVCGDLKTFGYMNLYSLQSSIYYNPDYIHIIWCPNILNIEPGFMNDIKTMKNVRIRYYNILDIFPQCVNWLETHKQDILKYYLLEHYGGMWSSLDTVYIRSINDVLKYNFDTLNCINPNRLMVAKRKNELYNYLIKRVFDDYDRLNMKYNGSLILENYLKYNMNPFIIDNNNLFILSNSISKGTHLFIKDDLYVKYTCNTEELFIKNKQSDTNSKTVGYYWFNESIETKRIIANIENYKIPLNYDGILFLDCEKYIKKYNNVNLFVVNIKDLQWAKYMFNKSMSIFNILKSFINVKIININSYISNNTNYSIEYELVPKKDELYIYDEMSYINLLYIYINSNIEIKNKIVNFLKNIKYIFFTSELICDNNLRTIGSTTSNINFSIIFYSNAHKIVLCNTKNRNYLLKYGIYSNVIYFPLLCNSKINNIVPLIPNCKKNIDILFYGNMVSEFVYRNDIINKLKIHYNKSVYKFLCVSDLYEQKNEILNRTKIVIHIPSHENLYTFPWAKIAELSAKKIFFIIEENEEMYIQNLDSVVVYYKKSDINDLLNKTNYYLLNEKEREACIERCYSYISMKYDTDNFIYDLVKDNI
jgi:hypothetical protein